MARKKRKSAYAAAGVDIDEKAGAIRSVKQMVDNTSVKGVMSGIGFFGGMFQSPGRDKILVASMDGVGTKLKIACLAGRHHTVGQDIVNHCVNDILVHGAEPLFFLDYIGSSQFEGWVFKAIVAGLCKACRENGCALLGGETAEMPGLYPKGEYDLVGTIVGVVDKNKIITGQTIRKGDAIFGLASAGLHTNGYSLARKVLFDKLKLNVFDEFPGTGRTVADVMLAIHKSYLKPIKAIVDQVTIRGMAHITGGGFVDNIPRVLPKNVSAVIDRSTWKAPPEYRFLQEHGRVGREEMYRVFNMGIGMVVIVRESEAEKAMKLLRKARAAPVRIGTVENGDGKVRLVN